MEFREDIKQLEKEYYNILKKYYSTNKLILKMIAMHNASELSEPDLCFRTCNCYSFSDKYINKLIYSNSEKAVHNLRVRAVCCMSTAQALDVVIMNCVRLDEKGLKFVEDLKRIRNKIYDLGQCSINQSNCLAKKHRLPYMTVDENYILRHHRNYDEDFGDVEVWDINNFK